VASPHRRPDLVALSQFCHAAEGRPRLPVRGYAQVRDDALGGYLNEARAILTAYPAVSSDRSKSAAVSEEFERLRWFELPRVCLAADPAATGSDPNLAPPPAPPRPWR
jgi:hypothetical protein